MSEIVSIIFGLVFGVLLSYLIDQILNRYELYSWLKKFKYVLGVWVLIVAFVLGWGPEVELTYEIVLFCLGAAIIIFIYLLKCALFKAIDPNG